MTDEEMITVYVSIGNSDDKLTQREWAHFVDDVRSAIGRAGATVHGFWLSPGDSAYQNACWCVEVSVGRQEQWLRRRLLIAARSYQQDSIAFAVARTEFLSPNGEWDA